MSNAAGPSRSRILALAVEECERLDIPYLKPEMIFARDARAVVAFMRARVIRRIYNMRLFSTNAIGRAFGLHHTTVLYARNRRDLDGAPSGVKEFIRIERVNKKRAAKAKEEARIIELLNRPKEAPAMRIAPPKTVSAVLASSSIPPIPLSRLMAGRA